MNLARKDNWVFGDKLSGKYLLRFNWFDIQRHVLVTGTHSTDNPRLKDYWKERDKMRVKDLPSKEQRIASKQNYICEECKDSLFNGEELHGHHVKHKKDGGGDAIHNLKLTHLYCHQQIHSK